MRTSYRTLAARNASQAARIDQLIAELEEVRRGERACASQLERIAHELSRGKDVIATHIVYVGHSSTVLHSPQQCMESLREALTAVGFDLRLELERVEGAEL